MNIPAPHFLLLAEASEKNRQGQWRFVLQAADGSATLEASDSEPGTFGQRLELMAAVRGLEALDQPSRVTLVTPSRYVRLGVAYGLDEWRDSGWTWERFGKIVPVKNHDLWQRFDQALKFHCVELRSLRLDPAHASPAACTTGKRCQGPLAADPRPEARRNPTRRRGGQHSVSRAAARFRRGAQRQAETWKLRCAQLGTCFLPKPWIE